MLDFIAEIISKIKKALRSTSLRLTSYEKASFYTFDPNKNRTDGWLSAFRLYLPSAALTNYDSIDNISYTGTNVNIEGVTFLEFLETGRKIPQDNLIALQNMTANLRSSAI